MNYLYDYFPHNENFHDDPRVIKMQMAMDWNGYGLYWALHEIMSKRPETCYRIPFTDLRAIAWKLHVSDEKLLTVIENFDLFDIIEDGTPFNINGRAFGSLWLADHKIKVVEDAKRKSHAGSTGGKASGAARRKKAAAKQEQQEEMPAQRSLEYENRPVPEMPIQPELNGRSTAVQTKSNDRSTTVERPVNDIEANKIKETKYSNSTILDDGDTENRTVFGTNPPNATPSNTTNGGGLEVNYQVNYRSMTADELVQYRQSILDDKILTAQLSVSMGLTPDVLGRWLNLFNLQIVSDGKLNKDYPEYKKHFNAWLKKQDLKKAPASADQLKSMIQGKNQEQIKNDVLSQFTKKS